MPEVTMESFTSTLDALLNANPHARSKGDVFKAWCLENFGADARISHIKQHRQTRNRLSEQFRYSSPIVVFVCTPEVKREGFIDDITNSAYKELENVCIIGVEEVDGERKYTFEHLLVFKESKFTEWAKPFFADIRELKSTQKGIQDTRLTTSDQAANEGQGNEEKSYPTHNPRSDFSYPLNCILYGAPGTGKTYASSQYAIGIIEHKVLSAISSEDRTELMKRYRQYIKEGRIAFTTFHQNYGYEDFIQGIRPDVKTGNMSFELKDGVFKIISDKAMYDKDNDYVIIIDEINRANISKVFGELITLIEDDKRWGEENAIIVTLPSGESFAVPNNLYIVGTMNSADKSISLIDTALRRRFEFIEYTPDLSLIEDPKLKTVLQELNKGISRELNSTDLVIGHSYFMKKSIDDLCDIMNRSVIPLLYEYFFDNQSKVEAQIKKAVAGLEVDVLVSNSGRIKLAQRNVE